MPGLSATRGQTLPRTCSQLLIHGFQSLWEEARSPLCVLRGGRRGVGLGAIRGPISLPWPDSLSPTIQTTCTLSLFGRNLSYKTNPFLAELPVNQKCLCL